MYIVHLCHWSVSSSLRQNNSKRNREYFPITNDNMSSFRLNFVDILSHSLSCFHVHGRNLIFFFFFFSFYIFPFLFWNHLQSRFMILVHSKLKNRPNGTQKSKHLFDGWPWIFHEFSGNVFSSFRLVFFFRYFSFKNRLSLFSVHNPTTNTVNVFILFCFCFGILIISTIFNLSLRLFSS